jgi:hypothetical protein
MRMRIMRVTLGRGVPLMIHRAPPPAHQGTP